MKTLYLRNVPDDVVRRLEKLADVGGTSVNAIAVRELAGATRWADNPELLDSLADLHIDAADIVSDLSDERAAR